MRKLIAVTVALLALAGTVHAVYAKDKTPLQIEDEQRAQERARIEKQYDTALKKTDKTVAAPAVNDPWANMRGTDDSKTKH